MGDITQLANYRQAIAAIKQRIQASQTCAVLAKVISVEQVLLSARACSENSWSRTVLEWQIEQRFHERAGQAVERNIENQLVAQCARRHRRSIVGSITVTDRAGERERASDADWRRREQKA